MSENIRKWLTREGRLSTKFFTPEIRASWQRCYDQGLDPFGEPNQVQVSKRKLEGLREENDLVRRLARIEMENLHRQIAGSKFIIVHADINGVILDRIVDASPTTDATERIQPGFIWREETNGTNALGLVAATHRPCIVHGDEHYFRIHTGLTCAASPILGRDETPVSILDATSNCQARQHHTLVLVRMSCVTIENGLFKNRNKDNLIFEIHNRQEFLGTLQSALLAFDEEGFLQESNRQARLYLQGIHLRPDIRFEEIFRTRFHETVDRLSGGRSQPLTDHEGSSFAVRAYNSRARRLKVKPSTAGPFYMAARETKMMHEDSKVKAAMHMVKRAVELSVPILIRGETGTGKELMARYAHSISGRQGEFVAVNCAALPETLVESELFGHREGAFTGASRKGAKGLVQQAHGGTLFLDEIGVMPVQIQTKLLRFLDRMEVRPVGKTTEVQMDIQLISATNAQLSDTEFNDTFRSDLLYRINTMEVHLPPLREREDLHEIIAAIMKSFHSGIEFTSDALTLLENYHWPGNIRELKSLLTRLFITLENGIVQEEDIREILPQALLATGDNQETKRLVDHERDIVLEAFERLQGNISAVARDLGISRNKVYKKLKEARKNR